MHTQLRLAEKQGLLSHPHLSPVQEWGLVALDDIEQFQFMRSSQEDTRKLVAELGWEKFMQFFQHRLPAQQQASSAEEIDQAIHINEDGESEGASYDFSDADPISEDEAARILELVGANITGSLSVGTGHDSGWL